MGPEAALERAFDRIARRSQLTKTLRATDHEKGKAEPSTGSTFAKACAIEHWSTAN